MKRKYLCVRCSLPFIDREHFHISLHSSTLFNLLTTKHIQLLVQKFVQRSQSKSIHLFGEYYLSRFATASQLIIMNWCFVGVGLFLYFTFVINTFRLQRKFLSFVLDTWQTIQLNCCWTVIRKVRRNTLITMCIRKTINRYEILCIYHLLSYALFSITSEMALISLYCLVLMIEVSLRTKNTNPE